METEVIFNVEYFEKPGEIEERRYLYLVHVLLPTDEEGHIHHIFRTEEKFLGEPLKEEWGFSSDEGYREGLKYIYGASLEEVEEKLKKFIDETKETLTKILKEKKKHMKIKKGGRTIIEYIDF